ncbi:pyridoxal-phosphate dependent enzyme [Aliivibrio fischeri]|uniref:cysteine synthase n=1 Tax=Aliivibrio fischeri TaxID=668 RepID=A0A510UQL3_ALIFS|nr:pyridoxal-phosphate dependent enzyme [Aliivibrio fischeri]GEK15721.1 cysteine synthase [Aliivibrio fischeri]
MYSHISDAIKKPHLIKLKKNLYVARFESMKIYSTLFTVKKLLERKIINKNSILIDSSSGIYAYALALACHKYKIKCHIIASKTVDKNIKSQLNLLGATVEGIDFAGTLKLDQEYRVKKVKNIIKENEKYYWMQQYHDDIHYEGYKEFAELLSNEISSDDLILVGGVGSGCSTGATATYLRENGKKVCLYGLQPYGSVTFGCEHVEDPEIIIAGIGSAIDFSNVKHSNYDYIDWLSFDLCRVGTLSLMRNHAIFAGLSSGGSYYVADKLNNQQPNKPCIFIAPDMGYRYVDDVFLSDKIFCTEPNEPKIITSADELSLPWSRIKWSREEKIHLNKFKNKKMERV